MSEPLPSSRIVQPPGRRRRRALPAVMTMCLALGAVGGTPAMAQEDDAAGRPDARVEGYQVGDRVGPKAIEKPRGTSSAWAILVLLGLLAVGVTFKAGKRTHLD